MYKISIIVPIYNVEEFITESIESILNQSIGFENLEVILVDDCSTDNSGEIAKKYSEQYENIIYYRMPENSGMAGRPRNIAIRIATGKYIMFLDPDDLYMPYSCEVMYDTIEQQKVKFVSSSYVKIDMSGNQINDISKEEIYNPQKMIMSKESNALNMLKDVCWNKIIDREFIIENSILFLEGVPAEDAYFSNKLFLIAKEGYYIDKPTVQYRIRDFGNLSETNNLKEKYFNRAISAYREIYKLFTQSSTENYYPRYYLSCMMYIINKLILSTQIEDSEKKAEILLSMHDLLKYARELISDFNLESDSIKFMEIFEMDDKQQFIDYVEKLEKSYETLGIKSIKKIQNEIQNELKI